MRGSGNTMRDRPVEPKSWPNIAPSGRPFIKMHGLRNHFVIVDGRDVPFHPQTKQVIAMCDTKTGIGAEQLLIVDRPSDEGASQGAYAFMRIVNIDGREAEACGNATRCIGYLLLEESGRDSVLIETLGGILECRRAGEMSVSVNMGKITMDWRVIPLSQHRDTLHLDIAHGPLKSPSVLNIGNPHVVYFVDDLDAIDLAEIAPPIQNDPLFPEQVNVGVAQMIDGQCMRLAVFERPGVLTTACGSGACVATYAARARGLTSSRWMTVEMSAGALNIEINADDTAIMTGPVAFCFQGHFL